MSVETKADVHLTRAREFLHDSTKELVALLFDSEPYKSFKTEHVEKFEDALMLMRKAQRLLE